ncbi:hypothetical protein ABZ540_16575 [Nocardia xishanensis]
MGIRGDIEVIGGGKGVLGIQPLVGRTNRGAVFPPMTCATSAIAPELRHSLPT